MPFQYKNRDITDMFNATNNSTKDITYPNNNIFIKNAPNGDAYQSNFVKPNPIGITIQGKDLSEFYSARYYEFTSGGHNVTIPSGVTTLKVMIVGGGGGGGGGSSNWHNGNQNGYSGGGGAGGTILIATIPKSNDSYTVSIGNGGSGSYAVGGTGGNVTAVGETNGNATVFSYNGNYTANGGGCGSHAHGNVGGAGGVAGAAGTGGRQQTGGYIVYSRLGSAGKNGGYQKTGGIAGNIVQNIKTGGIYPVISGYGGGRNGGNPGYGNGLNADSYTVSAQGGYCRVYYFY